MLTLRYLVIRLLFVPTLLYNLLMHRLRPEWRWWDAIDDHVILGALPLPRFVGSLASEGVVGVVNTCIEYGGPVRQYEQRGMRQLRVPTLDFTPPTLAHVEAAVAFIADHAARGEKVYVHCKAGRGRSATVVMCWLIQHQGMTPEQAQRRLEEIRPRVNPGLFRRQVVQEFAQRSSRS